MEKTINVGGQEVRLISSGASPLIYKSTFNHDFFKDFAEIAQIAQDAEKSDDQNAFFSQVFDKIPMFQRFIWTYAKNANPQLPGLGEWLATFDEFPVFDYLDDLIDLMMMSVSSKKN